MAEVKQYTFPLTEVAALLIKDAGIQEGLWSIGVTFSFAAVAAGPDKTRVFPSAVVGVESLLLTKAAEAGPLTFDAAAILANSK